MAESTFVNKTKLDDGDIFDENIRCEVCKITVDSEDAYFKHMAKDHKSIKTEPIQPNAIITEIEDDDDTIEDFVPMTRFVSNLNSLKYSIFYPFEGRIVRF